jgi:hypothetical protein
MQTEEPAVAWYLPAAQLSHAVAPASALYFPAMQSLHRVEPEVRTERGHACQQRKNTGESQEDNVTNG